MHKLSGPAFVTRKAFQILLSVLENDKNVMIITMATWMK